jgi:hypothetical protein
MVKESKMGEIAFVKTERWIVSCHGIWVLWCMLLESFSSLWQGILIPDWQTFEVVCVENYAVCHFWFCPNTGVCDWCVLSPNAEKYRENKCTVMFQAISYCIKLVALKQFLHCGWPPESQQFWNVQKSTYFLLKKDSFSKEILHFLSFRFSLTLHCC